MSTEALPDPLSRVVALVPCRDGAGTVGSVVTALRAADAVAEIVVVDDGSSDATATEALRAGARVIRLPVNVGKGGAVAAGLAALAPGTDVVLLVDADTEASAAAAVDLLGPVLCGEADIVVGALPGAGGQGGFGAVRRLAAWVIERACGLAVAAPLSGQRAVRVDLLRSLELGPRFGLEVAMTIDAVRGGARLVEQPVEMQHRHRGRSIAGFWHRGRQGADVVRVAWPRFVPRKGRLGLLGLAAALVVVALAVVPALSSPSTRPLPQGTAQRVLVHLVPGQSWGDPGEPERGAPVVASVVTGPVESFEEVRRIVGSGSREASAATDRRVSVAVGRPLPPAFVPPSGIAVVEVGAPVGDDPPELRPLRIHGVDAAGTATSRSTRRVGMVDLTDVAPSGLRLLGADQPAGSAMTGRPVELVDRSRKAGGERDLAALAGFYETVRPPFIAAYVLAQVTIFVVAVGLARRRRSSSLIDALALAVAATPLATYLLRASLGTRSVPWIAWSALLMLAVGIIVGVSSAQRPRPLGALELVLGATVVVLMVDLALGGPLQLSGIFGSSPVLGTRSYGLGNPAAAVLLVASVLWATLHVQGHTGRFGIPRWTGAAVLAVVAFAAGAPQLGADVGGLLALSMTAVALLEAFSPGRRSRLVLLAPIIGVVAVTIAAIADLARPAADRTHLGRLVARVGTDGAAPILDAVGRRVEANLAGYGAVFTVVVLLGVTGLLWALLRRESWSTTLPVGSPQRSGVVAALAGALVLWAVNDSGIVVLALVAPFLGPFLIAQHRDTRWRARLLEVKP